MRDNPDAFVSPAEAAAAKRAGEKAQVRTPREVLDAFAPLPLQIGKLQLQPLTLASLMVLERIESPLADENFGPETEVTVADTLNVLFIQTRTPAESMRLIGGGRAEFDAAVLELASGIDLRELPRLTLVLRETFTRAFAALVGGGGQKKTEGASSTPPPATASAGG